MSRDHTELGVSRSLMSSWSPCIEPPRDFPSKNGTDCNPRYAEPLYRCRRTPSKAARGGRRADANDYVHFLTVALGSASELRYLLDLSGRLQFLPSPQAAVLDKQCGELLRTLQRLVDSLVGKP